MDQDLKKFTKETCPETARWTPENYESLSDEEFDQLESHCNVCEYHSAMVEDYSNKMREKLKGALGDVVNQVVPQMEARRKKTMRQLYVAVTLIVATWVVIMAMIFVDC